MRWRRFEIFASTGEAALARSIVSSDSYARPVCQYQDQEGRMRVTDLIELLRQHDPNATVVLWDHAGHYAATDPRCVTGD